MKKTLVVLAVALAIPTSVAFAKAGHPSQRGKSNPMVLYVVKGTLSDYTAATSDTVGGSITITITHSNFHSSLKGQNMTLATTMKTKVNFRNGATSITDGAKGSLKFKAPLHRKGDTTLMATLTANAKALHIIDQARS
jgi:hypothetical protein